MIIVYLAHSFRAFLGFAFHGSYNHFCSKCGGSRAPDHKHTLRQFSRVWSVEPDDAFALKTHERAALAAQGWRDQTSKSGRSDWVKTTGFRDSPLYRLEYFDIIEHHVFDLFHLILEGTSTYVFA